MDTRLQGREVVIVEAARTPVGRGHREKGIYKDIHPAVLLGETYKAVIERAGIGASEVEDVVAGAVSEVGEQSNNIARNAWLQAGLPVETPAITVDRQCGSAQSATEFASGLIAMGVRDVAIGAAWSTWGGCRWAPTSPTRTSLACRSRPSCSSATRLFRRASRPR